MIRHFYISTPEKADELSRLLYQISNVNGSEGKMFGFMQSNTDNGAAMIIDVDYTFKVFPIEGINEKIDRIVTLMNGTLKTDEANEFRQFFNQSEVVLGNLIPSKMIWLSVQELIDRGFTQKVI